MCGGGGRHLVRDRLGTVLITGRVEIMNVPIRDTHILYCTPHFSRHYLRIDGETEVTVRGNEKNKSLPFHLSCSVFRMPKSARSF